MRCLSCDKILSAFEATRKYESSGEYLELCNDCFSHVESSIKVTVRKDLMHRNDDYDDTDFKY